MERWWAAAMGLMMMMMMMLLLLLRIVVFGRLRFSHDNHKMQINHDDTTNTNTEEQHHDDGDDGDDDDDDDDDDENMKTSIRRSRIPKGSSGWPLIGETLDFIATSSTSMPVSFMHRRKSLYGKVFRTHLLGKPVIVSTDPEINKVVLQNHGNIFIPSYPKSITELFGESSILRMNGALHKRVHASIGRFLKSPDLKSQITTDIENSVKLTLQNWTNCPLIHVQDETNQITFEILVKVLMSLGPGEEMVLFKKEYKEFIKGLICLPINFPGTQLYKSLKAKERLLKMIRRLIEERLISKANSQCNLAATDTNSDAIDVLLRDIDDRGEVGRSPPLDFVAGNIIEMMVPGEDSVPMVMTLAVYYLTHNPAALEHLVDENMALKKQKANSGNSYVWTDYMSLTFTQNVISETLRMANIINAIWRQATKDVEIKGYLMPKGWCVLASLTSIHMDEQNYENPYHFDPWRWEENKGKWKRRKGGGKFRAGNENGIFPFPPLPYTFYFLNNENKGIVASSYIFAPFGGGQRLCPGLEFARLEISIFLHHFVTTYRWVAEKDEIVYFPTVKMKQKLPISVTPKCF